MGGSKFLKVEELGPWLGGILVDGMMGWGIVRRTATIVSSSFAWFRDGYESLTCFEAGLESRGLFT